jgi:diaminopimelate decarboxylase
MSNFYYQDGTLMVEQLSARDVAQAHGTPTYVYSAQALREGLGTIQKAFAAIDPLVCFSVKSCPNLSVLKLLVDHGAGLDVVSGGELRRALQAGAPPEKIVFAGVGKSRAELTLAIEQGVLMFNVESTAELERINEIAGQLGRKVQLALRVNPDVADETTHAKTSTGGRETKFGIPLHHAEKIITDGGFEHVDICGLHVHLGSPLSEASPYLLAIDALEQMEQRLAAAGREIRYINVGGGYPVSYASPGQSFRPVLEIGQAISERLQSFRARGKKFVVEPGRSVVANAGMLICQVEYMKQGWDHKIAIVNAGMNTLIRPTLYGAFHLMWPAQYDGFSGDWEAVARVPAEGLEKVDVVGPICETGDYLALSRSLPALKGGDLLAVFSCGAYGMSMASNYNSHGRPAEVLVDGDQMRLIRRREVYEDLVAHELDLLQGA